MSMREEFEKWFEGYAPFAPEHLDDCAFAAWQAAYLAGAKAMQEEAVSKCNKSDRYRGYIFAELIKEIDLETLVNSTENL